MVASRRRLSRRDALRLLGLGALALALPGRVGWWYLTRGAPQWLRIPTYRVALPGLHPHLRGLRVVQLSDLHADGVFGTAQRLAWWNRTARSLRPDLIVLTGDFITHHPRWAADLRAGLQGLQAPLGVFAVLGNHDYWVSAPAVMDALASQGIRVLRNQVVLVRRGAGALALAGLDDVMENHHDLARVVAALPPQGPALLLAHEPDIADQVAATGRFAWQLSGHSHGGQVCLPGIGPIVLPPYGQRYPRGWYRVGPMLLYTNRGLGMVPPRVRFGCPPEMAVFVLEPAPDDRARVRLAPALGRVVQKEE